MSAPSRNAVVALSLAGAALFLAGVLAGAALGPGGRAASRESVPPGLTLPSFSATTRVAPGRSSGGGAGGGARASSTGAASGMRPAGASTGARAGGRGGQGDSEEGKGEAGGAPAGPSMPLDEAIARLAGDPSPEFAERYAAELIKDRRAMDAALARLRSEGDPARLEALAFLLAQARTPEVEAAAVDMALRADRAHRLAALGLLDRFETPASIGPAVETLRNERDAALVSAAVYALPEPQGASREDGQAVVEGLRRALASPDAEARRRAVIALASWLPPAEAEPLLAQVLERDTEASVRAGAAYGLEVVRPRLEPVVALLARVMSNRGEDRVVRENAWRALGAVGPLPPELAAAWRAFAEEMEARED